METKKVYCCDCEHFRWGRDIFDRADCSNLNGIPMKDSPMSHHPAISKGERYKYKNEYNDCPDFKQKVGFFFQYQERIRNFWMR